MSYEKVTIKSVETVQSKDGKQHRFLQVETSAVHGIYITDAAEKLLPLYEKLIGKQCLIPVNWAEFKGKPSLNFAEDCKPLPVNQL